MHTMINILFFCNILFSYALCHLSSGFLDLEKENTITESKSLGSISLSKIVCQRIEEIIINNNCNLTTHLELFLKTNFEKNNLIESNVKFNQIEKHAQKNGGYRYLKNEYFHTVDTLYLNKKIEKIYVKNMMHILRLVRVLSLY